MRIKRLMTRSRTLARIGLVTGVTAASLLGTATPSFAAAVAMTLSQSSGPSTGGNTLSATTATSATSDGKFPASTVIEFQATTAGTAAAPGCAPAYLTPGTSNAPPSVAANVKVFTPNRVTFTVPTTLN